MAVEADRLKAGKAPREEGTVREIDGGYRAEFHWRHIGSLAMLLGIVELRNDELMRISRRYEKHRPIMRIQRREGLHW